MGFDTIKDKELYKSLTLFQPTMPFLVTTLNEDNSVHIAPFAWGTPISLSPPMMCLALGNKASFKSDSLVNIERTGEYVVNLVNQDLTRKLVQASHEYSEGVKKFEKLEFCPVESNKLDTPGIKEARAHIECRVKYINETGDHKLIVSDIVAASFNPDYYTGNLLLDVEKAKPIIHLEQYTQSNGQIHVLINTNGNRVFDIPYLEKLDLDTGNTEIISLLDGLEEECDT